MTGDGYRRLLVVTAVEAERTAVLAGLRAARRTRIPVEAVGVGPAAAAAGTARLLAYAEAAGSPYDAVLCAGIGGGFRAFAPVGRLAVATASVAADLGVDGPAGFTPIDELGFGSAVATVDAELLATVRAALPKAVAGTILTVETVTGTGERAAELRRRYPDAAVEAMEGFGVATAAAGAGAGFGELRAISNPVGPRDRAGWRMAEAFAALTAAFRALGPALGPPALSRRLVAGPPPTAGTPPTAGAAGGRSTVER